MDAERYRIVKEILNQALDRPPEGRAAFLGEACGDDVELRAEVEGLLDEPVGTGFLEAGALALDADADEEALIGRTLGRIRIRGLIARGGMGVVYDGIDELLERPVAVKVIRGEWQLSDSRRAALLDEARLLSGVGHPNICELHDFFIEDDLDVLVMERVEGRTLRDILDGSAPNDQKLDQKLDQKSDRTSNRTSDPTKGPLSDPIEVAAQIAEALVSAHERGVAHLDLKPENVMQTASGQVKVLDFGVARPVAATQGNKEAAAAIGPSALGTPGYHAPEQAKGQASTASDLWSFGILLLELLGAPPARRTGSNGTDASGTSVSADDAAARIPARLPRAERALLRRLLNPEPSQRPTARETRDALKRILGRPRRRLAWSLAAGALAVLVFVGYRYTIDLQFERNQALAARAEAEELAGFMVVDLYDGLFSVGRLDLLEPVALKAVDYYGRLEPGADEPGQSDAALALLRVGEVLELQGHQDRSIEAIQRAEAALEALASQQPGDEPTRYRLALARLALGTALRYAGEQDRAAEASAAALEMARSLAQPLIQSPTASLESTRLAATSRADDDAEPTDTERWQLLLKALYEEADGRFRIGRAQESIPLLQEAETLATAALPEHPALNRNLADIRWLTCMVYYDQRVVPGVVDACRASLAIDRERYLESPDDLTRLAFYFDANWSLVNAYRLNGQHGRALELADYAEQLAERLVARDPERFHNQNRLAVILVSQAHSLKAIGDETTMRETLQRVLEITGPLMGDPELVAVNNRMTALAMLGRIDQARPLAREIYDGGWRQREFLDLCREFALIAECGAATSR